MKKLKIFLLFLLASFAVFSQTPAKMSFQSVIRDSKTTLVVNSRIGVQVSILKDSPEGSIVFRERHAENTNQNGLLSLEIGTGTPMQGKFQDINWSSGTYYIKLETDITGGTNYSISGISQLLSVPYSLHAKTVEVNPTTGNESVFNNWDKNISNDVITEGNQTINGIKTFNDRIITNGLALPYTFGPDTAYTGNPGAYIGFGHSEHSEDFIGYRNNRFYFKDSPGGGDINDPDVIVGGKVGIGVEDPVEKLEVNGVISSITGGFKFPDGTIQNTAASGIGGGDITGVNAGTGLSGGGVSGDVSLNIQVPLELNSNGEFISRLINETNNTQATLGATEVGVFGAFGPYNYGYLGGKEYGVYGYHSSNNFGYIGGGILAVFGQNANGNTGALGGRNYGVYGQSGNNFAQVGSTNYGIYSANMTSKSEGYIAGDSIAVWGKNGNGNMGYIGGHNFAVYGEHKNAGNYGYLGSGNAGVFGYGDAASSNYAGYFNGDVTVTGKLVKGSGSFKIDHPLDPGGKFLSHSFVESPDMKNIYDGVTVLDENGEAKIILPDWFDALNNDFRYQLTCIGGFANVYIAEEIKNNQFKIAGGKQGLKVSWQVTGIRKDPYAVLNPIKVEEKKTGAEIGKYLHPEAFGYSKNMSILNDQ